MCYVEKRRAAQMFAPLACSVDAVALPLAEKLALILGQTSHHRQDEAARRRRGVDPKIQDAEMNLARLEIVRQEKHLSSGTAEAADFRDYDGIAGNKSRYEGFQLGPPFDSGCLLDDYF
jgi:hypothetical protein